MTTLSRLEKLEEKLLPKVKQVHFVGWADCEWRECDGLFRRPDETKEQFFRRIKLNNPKKKVFWHSN
jgi:hypothetical protein